MIKVRKGNVAYKIDPSQLKRFLYMGYTQVDDSLKHVEEDVNITLESTVEEEEVDEALIEDAFEQEPKKRKNIHHMTKAELLDCAIELGVDLQGDENASQVIELIKEKM